MRTIVIGLMAAGLVGLLAGAAAADGSRVGVGPEYDFVSGDADDAWGGYATYTRDVTELLAVQFGASYVGGDFDFTPELDREGSYTSFGLDGLLLVRREDVVFTPYAGVGAGYYFNDFDDVSVNDKLAMLFLAGFRLPLADTLDFDMSLRFRFLRPDTYEQDLTEVSMDAWVLRAGVCMVF
jgi:hypothetical protein